MTNEEVQSDGKMPDRSSLIELKSWLEGARDLQNRAVQAAESKLVRMRQIESAFARTEALSPVVERLADIRGGIEECLGSLRDHAGEWALKIAWINELERVSPASGASTEEGTERRIETPDDVPSEPSTPDFGVASSRGEEQAANRKNTFTAALSKAFSEHTLLILFSLVFVIAIEAASLTYLIANHFHQLEIGELHQSISILKGELSTSYSANKELTLKNADLNNYMAESEPRLNELKSINKESELALQKANSSLTKIQNDLHIMQSTNLKMISELKAKSLELVNNRIELEESRHLSEFFRTQSGMSFILNPVWLNVGEVSQIPGGELTIRVEQAHGQNSCTDALLYVSSSIPVSDTLRRMNPPDKTFCARPGIPESFRFKNNRYSVVLLGSKTTDAETKAYQIAVLKK